MSSTGHSDERQRAAQGPWGVGVDYVPTDDEKRVFKECNQESFMYRSLPFSVVSMAITRGLIARGTLAASPRFGSSPKVAFAGLCGYMVGKMSYMKVCQEKFKRLENSPLGEAMRKRSALPLQHPQGVQSEMGDGDPNAPSFDAMFQPPAESSSQIPHQRRDYEYSDEPPLQPGRADDINPPVQSYMEDDDEPRKKVILYEDLRTKNRENYEVTLTQKAETLLKSPPEREPDRSLPKNDGKKNVYGDSWEE